MIKFIMIGLLTLFAQSAAFADNHMKLTIADGWVRATHGQMNMTAAYFTLNNAYTHSIILQRVSSPTARVEMHNTVIDDKGVAAMRQMDVVSIPPNHTVEFVPGGMHIMLMDLAEPLHAGDMVTLTLYFDQNHTLNVELPVVAAMQKDSNHSHH